MRIQPLVLLVTILRTSQQQEIFHIPVKHDTGTVLVTYERSDYTISCRSILWDYREECKYYGECCYDPVRVREVLEPGTYQCQNIGSTQGYVVISCPTGTDDELSQLCTQESNRKASDLSISNWPVTGSYTGITYSNMYCAICNGALSPVTNNDLSGVFNPQKALEFWTIEVYCNNSTIELIERDEEYFVTSDELQKHLQEGSCWTNLRPTYLGIHHEGCGEYITRCPEAYPEGDLRDLCEKGPTNEVCIDSSDNSFCLEGSYKNVFCQLCWEKHSVRAPVTNNFHPEGIHLMSARPMGRLQSNMTEFSGGSFNIPLEVSKYFIKLENDDHLDKIPFSSLNDADEPFWDLGSILCQSNYSRVCGEFIVYPEEGECSLPGCGEERVQDLLNTCTKTNSFPYNPETTFNRSFLWADSLLAKTLSTCKSNAKHKNCRCDQRCHYFGDCCFDALPPLSANLPVKPLSQSGWTCYEFDRSSSAGIFVIHSCPDNTTEVASLCRSGVVGEWNVLGWLVSDKDTKLTYKNIHCATCNGASNTIFWDALMDCPTSSGEIRGHCEFVHYTLPSRHEDIYYPCTPGVTYISVCPDIFRGWQIDEDCRSQPTSFVYIGRATYRNSYCAICNLGDDIRLSVILPENTYPLRTKLYTYPSVFFGEIFDTFHRVKFSYEDQNCCGKCEADSFGQCQVIKNFNSSEWGSTTLPPHGDCTKVPFDMACHNIAKRVPVQVDPMSFHYLCPGVSITCFVTTVPVIETTPFIPWYTKGGGPTGHYFPGLGDDYDQFDTTTDYSFPGPTSSHPDVVAGVFSGNVAARDQAIEVKVKEKLLTVSNETFWFCPNKTIIMGVGNETEFQRILLGSGAIQLQTYDSIREVKAQKRSRFNLYDFILIGLSLLSIAIYLIYFMVSKKRFTIADKMMVAMLFSLFGALTCFAFITTPPVSDLIGCQLIAALTQFFFLSSLTWSNSMAISIVRTLHTLLVHRESHLEFLWYTIYSFGLPFACVTITYILSTANISAFDNEVYETEVLCFIGEVIVIYALFLGPVYVLLLVNCVMGVIAMVKIAKSGKVGSSQDKNRMKKQIISCFKISVSLGMGWLFLFFVTIYDKLGTGSSSLLWKIMQVFVELQGVLIVLSNLIGWDCLRSVKRQLKQRSQMSGSQSDSTKITSASNPAETRPLNDDIPMRSSNQDEWDDP